MNFLELVNLTRMEAGVAGDDLPTLQSGLSRESRRFKSWVQSEWDWIQSQHSEWRFLQGAQQFNTVAGTYLYTPAEANAPDLAKWKLDSVRVAYETSLSDENFIDYMPWPQFRDHYVFGSSRATQSRPVTWSIDPANKIALGHTPDQVYKVVFEYEKVPVTLSLDSDTPTMPARFHSLVAYRALLAYGVFVASPELIDRAERKTKEMQPLLFADQLPMMELGPTLS